MSKILDAVIGHAVGDAMGVPTEFCIREKLLNNPVTEMIGYGSHPVPKGTWSDDTSMSIATIYAIVNNNGNINLKDIMMNFYYWLKEDKFTPDVKAFGVGRACFKSIAEFSRNLDITTCGQKDIKSNGNGSLMRIYPIALYSFYKKLKDEEIVKLVNDISSLTHAHDISKLGCYIYVRYLIYLLEGLNKEDAYKKIRMIDYSSYDEESIKVYKRILDSNIINLKIDDIKSSGYIVDTLEASLWILLNSKDYKECIIASTNIGQDTDTIGAVTGAMAGIIYGVDSIPLEWRKTLVKYNYLLELADGFERVLTNNFKLPLSKEDALKIASKALRNSYYRESYEEGEIYTSLDFNLEAELIHYNGKEAYHVYVNGGSFCFETTDEYRKKFKPGSIFSKLKHNYGEYTQGKNNGIECIIYKDTGIYEYLDKSKKL